MKIKKILAWAILFTPVVITIGASYHYSGILGLKLVAMYFGAMVVAFVWLVIIGLAAAYISGIKD